MVGWWFSRFSLPPPLHTHTHLWLLGSLLSKRTDDTDTTQVDCSDLPAAPGDLL